MPIDFRNLNTLWASVLVETLVRLGLSTVVISPGSRSTPLTVAFAQHPQIEAIPILDERSAAFFALGMAQRRHQPIALVCTSGTAGANFFPAVIEARESRVPLLVLTADRPAELRHCNAGQAIDQQKLFGAYVNFYAETAQPALTVPMLQYLRQTLISAWQQTCYPIPGVVHLNLPFAEPLAPIGQPEVKAAIAPQFPADFFDHIQAVPQSSPTSVPLLPPLVKALQATERGIIVAGVARSSNPTQYCQAIAALSKTFALPVLAEALSPLRNYADRNPYLVTAYDILLRNSDLAANLAPQLVIRIGDMPTSKELRQWLTQTQPQQWVIDPSGRNLDPLHGKTQYLPFAIESLAIPAVSSIPESSAYLQQWLKADAQIRQTIATTLDQEPTTFEGKAAWLLSQTLPPGTPLFVANSMPVRDMDWFWQPGNRGMQVFFNRGANGIDGTLSTALGIAHRHQSSVLLTGDLALLHDTNGFLSRRYFVGHLTIVLINNDGGGIFGMLPIAPFDPPFEEFFATPQHIDFAKLCQTYEVEHHHINTWAELGDRLNPLPTTGIRVLELSTDRRQDAHWRQTHLAKFASQVDLDPPLC